MNEKIIEILKDIAQAVDGPKYSQFTIDWIEEFLDRDGSCESTVGALAYEIQNILDVMRMIPDRKVFQLLLDVIRTLDMDHE
jgi:hypothetical protein